MAKTTDREKIGRYDFAAIESAWQAFWGEHQTFRSLNPGEPGADTSKPKYYILDMFPYPSGAGLHVGHPVGYCATDIIARYKRMCGFNVLHPMGFDAFGLPAEQYAVETNVHPDVTTKKNIEMYRRQLKMFGFSYDWSREVATCDASYYKFTQWMFALMFESWYDECGSEPGQDSGTGRGRARPISELVAQFDSGEWGVSPANGIVREAGAEGRREWADLSAAERRGVLDAHRLAFMDEIPVNWCPALGTVLANEEVDADGRSERGGHKVYRRPLRQWMLRITKYADRLLEDLADLDWPEPIKLMQRNWVGKSTGAEVVFPLADKWTVEGGRWKSLVAGTEVPDKLSYENFPDAIKVYTTRPDTLFGATYMVLAPEHPLVAEVTTPEQRKAVDAYIEVAAHRSDMDRTAESKEKTGVFTGGYALNPVSGDRVPIWIADYVLLGYGTGAIMAVPGGDTRDFEFACTFDIPIVAVVEPTAEWIVERVAVMAGELDSAAKAGFDDIAREFPDLTDAIAERREQAADLGDKTVAVLREIVGPDKLAAHFGRHPRSWGDAFTGEGVAINSPTDGAEIDVPGGVCAFNGLPTHEAKAKITEWLETNGVGRAAVNYKLRDWLFSRQRYWGEPFPVLHDEDGDTIAIPEDELPVELPEMADFKPTPSDEDSDSLPEPPLGRAKEWTAVTRDGKSYRRDVNTMPQWAGSCWYYLRFIDPTNTEHFCDAEAEKYWMPIDLYVGGAEHAVLHLLYARFWHKVLFDLGHVSTREPFKKLFNQGMIQSFAYRNARGLTVGPALVEDKGDETYALKETGEPVVRVIAKMSKALKNVVNPDEIIAEHGADTFRLYEMYMGPLESDKPWNTRDVPGLNRLCHRIWRLVIDEYTGELSETLTEDAPDESTLRVLHKTTRRVTEELEQIKLNTAIAGIFDFVNAMTPLDKRPKAVIEPFVLLLAPFTPHLAEELWRRLGHEDTLTYEPWPTFDAKLTEDAEVEVAVQVCGKIKGRVTVPADADEEAIKAAAMADAKVASAVEGKTIRKVIVVKGRLVNIVAT